MIDLPGGGWKMPATLDYIVSMDDEKAVLHNYEGKLFTYPNPIR